MTEPARPPRLTEEGIDLLLLAAQLDIPVERRAQLTRRFGPMLGLANRLSGRMRNEPATASPIVGFSSGHPRPSDR